MLHPHEESNLTNPLKEMKQDWLDHCFSELILRWKEQAEKRNKVNAMKLYRSLYGCSLMDAKAGVEHYTDSIIFKEWRRKLDENVRAVEVVKGMMSAGIGKQRAKDTVVSWIAEKLEEV